MNTKNKLTKRIVLGEGEIAGHKHILECKKGFTSIESPTSIDFLLKDLGILTHDEHAKTIFRSRKHSSYHQVENNPFDDTVNNVFD